jgi:hypothetical protein
LGRQVPITLDVESLPLGLAVFEFFEQRALDTLVNGLPQVASDNLGKEALESKVQSVRLVYDKTVETVDKAVNFEDKTLVLRFYWDGLLMLDGDLLADELSKRF